MTGFVDTAGDLIGCSGFVPTLTSLELSNAFCFWTLALSSEQVDWSSESCCVILSSSSWLWLFLLWASSTLLWGEKQSHLMSSALMENSNLCRSAVSIPNIISKQHWGGRLTFHSSTFSSYFSVEDLSVFSFAFIGSNSFSISIIWINHIGTIRARVGGDAFFRFHQKGPDVWFKKVRQELTWAQAICFLSSSSLLCISSRDSKLLKRSSFSACLCFKSFTHYIKSFKMCETQLFPLRHKIKTIKFNLTSLSCSILSSITDLVVLMWTKSSLIWSSWVAFIKNCKNKKQNK